jgi:hypothetical protein
MSRNPKITEIILDEETAKDLQQKLKNPHISDDANKALIKKVVGGFCSHCGGIPTKIVSYDMEGAKKIEKYCNRCCEGWDELRKRK